MIPPDSRPKAERGTLDLRRELDARRREPLTLGNRVQIALIVAELDARQRVVTTQPESTRHQPFTDDGVTYCGWDGIDGCGEVWPCSTVRAARAAEVG